MARLSSRNAGKDEQALGEAESGETEQRLPVCSGTTKFHGVTAGVLQDLRCLPVKSRAGTRNAELLEQIDHPVPCGIVTRFGFIALYVIGHLIGGRHQCGEPLMGS